MSKTVVLVPGFLGFERLATVPYFREVQELLAREFERQGGGSASTDVQVLRTLPTASLGLRAARLAEVLAEVPEANEIHLVGHSTGGLDCRLCVSPAVNLPTSIEVEPLACRVKSVVTVSTPNYGTPIATYFTGIQGHRALRLVSLVMTHALRGTKASFGAALEIAEVVLLLDRIAGVGSNERRQLQHEVEARVHEIGADKDPTVAKFLQDVGDDDSLVEQLTPASIELLNAATGKRPTTRYGSVVTMAPPPTWRNRAGQGIHPLRHATFTFFATTHRLAATMSARRLPRPSAAQRDAIVLALGRMPRREDSDGMVPTLSQIYGEIVDAVHCDHLDLMGYYGGDRGSGHLDLLSCGAKFGRLGFEKTWREVARYISRSPPDL